MLPIHALMDKEFERQPDQHPNYPGYPVALDQLQHHRGEPVCKITRWVLSIAAASINNSRRYAMKAVDSAGLRPR